MPSVARGAVAVAGPDTGGDCTVKLMEINRRYITVELMPEDCLLIAQAFRASHNHESAPDLVMADTLATTFQGLAMAAASYSYANGLDDFTLARVWRDLGPQMVTAGGQAVSTDIGGQPSAPAEGKDGAATREAPPAA